MSKEFNEKQLVSGRNLLHIRDFIKHKWGKEGLENFQRETKINFDMIMAERFYPFRDYVEYMEYVKNIFGDEKAAYKIGCHRARNLLLAKGIDKKGLELLKKVAVAWNKFNTFGEISIIEKNHNKFAVVLSEYESHPLYCERTRGFFSGLIKCVLNDTCSVKEVKCVQQGHDSCEFVIEIKNKKGTK